MNKRSLQQNRAKVLTYLNQFGKAIKVPSKGYIEVGTPDIFCCIKGRMIVVELKRDDEPTSDIQYHRMQQWHDAGALTLQARTMKEIEEFIKKHFEV